MSLAHACDTVPAFPLGQPLDGRPRYGMTPYMAHLYRWLIANRAQEGEFKLSFRDISEATGESLSSVHAGVRGLVERGWLHRTEYARSQARFAFVHPIMRFREPSHG